MATKTQIEYNAAMNGNTQTIIYPPPKSTVFFDGFTAALWGSLVGLTICLCVVATLFSHNHRMAVVATIIIALIAIPGNLVHLSYKKNYHRVVSVKHFFGIFRLALILSSTMFVIAPAVLLIGILLQSRSFQEEAPIIGRSILRKINIDNQGEKVF